MNRVQRICAVAACLGAWSVTAQAQIVVVAHPSSKAITKEQVAKAYLGGSFEFKPVDFPEGASVRDGFYKKLADHDPAAGRVAGGHAAATGKHLAPLMLPDAATVRKAVSTDPKAIGYMDRRDVDSSVKAVLTLE